MKSISKTLITVVFIFFIFEPVFSKSLTVPEKTKYRKTSSYSEVMKFLYEMESKSEKVKLKEFCVSTEGKKVPLVIISNRRITTPSQMHIFNLPSILIMANIHAGEVEGKEASLMLIRDFAEGKINSILENQVVLIIPIFNSDGNDKFGKNRGDNGPELAGVRYNGQHLDLNRDYIKLESPEVTALLRVFINWRPVLFMDLHTTDGSYHREPVTFTTLSNPNSNENIFNYMWNKFFPSVQKYLKKQYKTDIIPYGNFIDRRFPEKGWANHAYEARYGTNYAGLRNMFTILDENYAHADFKTRVLSSYYFLRSTIEFTKNHIKEMDKIRKNAEIDTSLYYYKKKHILTFKTEKMFDFTIKSYEFEVKKIKPEERKNYPPWFRDFIVTKKEKHKDYKLPYFGKAVSEKSIELPTGYFILPFHKTIEEKLKKHGIIVEKLLQDYKGSLENFKLSELKYGKYIFQGHIVVDAAGKYVKENVIIPAGSLYISMKQPLARLIAEMLEPEAKDSFLSWGFFNREIIKQWSRKPGLYPVYRYSGNKEVFVTLQE